MHKLLVASVLLSAGCGTILNKQHMKIRMDDGVSVDGQTISGEIDQKTTHVVTCPDGRTCTIDSGVSVPYVILDIFLTGPIGIVIDAVTGGWTVSKSDCPGVYDAD